MRWLVTALLVGGCHGRTELMVGVVTELKAPDLLDEVRLEVDNNLVPVNLGVTDWPIGNGQVGTFVLPGSYGLNSSDGSEPPVQITLTGFKGGNKVVVRSARTSLVSGKTLFMRMGLVVGCMGNFGCADGQSCIEGACRDNTVDAHTLPDFKPELVDHVTCATGDMFISTKDGSALPTLGDMQCAGACVEGTCYKPATSQVWTPLPTPPTVAKATLNAIWGTTATGYDVFAVGDRGDGTGVALHLAGGPATAASGWVEETLPAGTPALHGVGGNNANDVWAVGVNSTLLHRVNGNWTSTDTSFLKPGTDLRAIAFDAPNEGFIVGACTSCSPPGGGVLSFDGTQWMDPHVVSSAPPLNGFAIQSGRGLAVGDGATLIGYARGVTTPWAPFPVIAQLMGANLYGAGGDGQAGYAVGQGGMIARITPNADGTAPVVTVLPSMAPATQSKDLFAVFGAAPGNVYAVGARGTILHATDGVSFDGEPSGTNGDLRAIWASSASDVYAVGGSGTVLHSTGASSGTPPLDGGMSCPPKTCAQLGFSCGPGSDGCGNMIDCGSCASGLQCNAGVCGGGTVDMASGGGCSAGQINLGMPVLGFDTDGTNIYFVAGTSPSWIAGKVPVCGTAADVTSFPSVTSMLASPGALVTNGTDVWFVDGAGNTNPDAGTAVMELIRMDVNGNVTGSGIGVGTFQPNPQTALAMDGSGNVYWLGQTGPYQATSTGTVTSLGSGGGDPRAIAVDQSNVYWSQTTMVMKMAQTGGNATATGAGTIIRGVTSVPTVMGAWYGDESNGKIYTTFGQIGSITGAAGYLTTDANYLYIATYAGANDTLYKMPASGSTGQSWMSGLHAPITLHVDANNVYVLDQGVIQRTPK